MFSVERQGAVDIVTGNLPIAGENVEKLAEQFESCLSSGQPMVVLDMSKMALLDSKGLEMLLDYSEKFARVGGELRLAGANALCADIFRVTGLTQDFEFFTGHTEAVGSFSR